MTEPVPPPAPAAPSGDRAAAPSANGIGRGMLLVLAGHALAILGVATFGGTQFAEAALLAFFFVAVYQWLYVLPLAIWAHATRRHQTAKGVWIMAGISILPTAACFGVISVSGLH